MPTLKAIYTTVLGYSSSLLAGFSLDNVGIIIGILGVIATTIISYLRYKLEVKKLNQSN